MINTKSSALKKLSIPILLCLLSLQALHAQKSMFYVNDVRVTIIKDTLTIKGDILVDKSINNRENIHNAGTIIWDDGSGVSNDTIEKKSLLDPVPMFNSSSNPFLDKDTKDLKTYGLVITRGTKTKFIKGANNYMFNNMALYDSVKLGTSVKAFGLVGFYGGKLDLNGDSLLLYDLDKTVNRKTGQLANETATSNTTDSKQTGAVKAVVEAGLTKYEFGNIGFRMFDYSNNPQVKVSRVHKQLPKVTNGSISKYYLFEPDGSSGFMGSIAARYLTSDYSAPIGSRDSMGVFYHAGNNLFELQKTKSVTPDSVVTTSNNDLKPGIYTIADTNCFNPPVIHFSSSSYSVCDGKSIEIVCESVTQRGVFVADSVVTPISYSWKGFSNSSNKLTLNNVVSPNKTIALTVKTKDGCKSTKSIPLTVYQNPKSKIKITNWKNKFCEGDSAIVSDSIVHAGGTYSWSPINDKYTGNEYRYSPGPISSNMVANISLTYTDVNGCQATSSVATTFILKPKTTIAFADTSVCLDTELIIKNNTQNYLGIAKYVWDMGNGDTIAVERYGAEIIGTVPIDTSHVYRVIPGMPPPGLNVRYNTPGIYTIKLKASADGCADSTTNTATIFPSVKAGIKMVSNDTVCLQNKFSFCAIDTTGKTFITSYRWMLFNDAGSSTPVKEFTVTNFNDTVSYVFASDGVKKIGLEVFSQNGCSNSTYANVYVAPPLKAEFAAAPVCFGNNTLITNTSSAGHNENYTWTIEGANVLKTDTLAFTHRFPSDGKYKVLLHIGNKYGCTDTVSHEVTVWPLPKAVMETRNACLNAQSADTLLVNHSVNAVSYTWQFGDGSGSSVAQPLKHYTEAKTYHVSLDVTNVHGCSAHTQDSVIVFNAITPSISASNACTGTSISFTAPAGAENYAWNFGDGTSLNSLSSVASHTYTKAGSYNVSLKLTTANGCASETSKLVTAYPVPAATFTVSPACIGETSGFELSDSTSNNQNCSYFWNFGDNTTSNTKNAVHAYSKKGSFPVKLTVTSNNNCTAEGTTIAVVDTLPEAHFGSFTGTCNDKITLSAKNDNCTYLWNDNSTADTLVVTRNGRYSVTIRNTITGCSVTSSTDVKLHSKIEPQLPDFSACGKADVKTSVYGATYLWSTGATSQSITLADTGTHVVSIKVTKDGCSGFDTATISVRPLPVFDLGANKTLCFGDRFTLNALPVNVSGKSYQWSSSDPLFGNPVTPAVILENSSAQIITQHYMATVTSTFNCTATDNVDVTFRPKPLMNLGNDIALCDGGSKTLDAMIVDGTDYIWNDGYISPSRTITTTLNGKNTPENITWWAKATDKFGCSVKDTVVVTVNPNPVIALENAYNHCNGDTLFIDATQAGVTKYVWDPATTQSPVLKLYNNTNASVTKTIRLEVTNSFGCKASSKWIDVKFKEAPQKALPALTTGCNLTVLNAGNPGATFAWNNGQSGQYQVVRNTGLYKVRVTNANNCSIDDSTQVTIKNMMLPNLGGYRTVCANSQLELITGISNPQYSFLWSNTSTTPTIKVSTSGKYWVKVTHTNGCEATDTVQVDAKDAPSVDLGPDVDLCSNEYFPITTSAKGALYYWGSTNKAYEKITEKGYIEVKDTGTYWVKVLTADGCQSSDTIKVRPTSNPIFASFLAISKFKTGDSIQFMDLSHPNPVKWFWDLGDMRVSHDQDPLHVYYSCDTFKVVLNVSNGVCQSALAKEVIVSGCTKSGKFAYKERDNRFVQIVSSKLYPNPTAGDLYLDVDLSTESDIFVYIFSLMGQLQKMERISKSETIRKYYNIGRLPAGIYLVKIVAGGDQKTYKIIKQ